MKENKVTFGFWVYLMSDCVLFATLFATYVVLQHTTFAGPAIHDIVSVPFVFVETLLLLTSSFTAGLALLAARHHKKEWALMALATTLALGLLFVGMEIQEFNHLVARGHGPSTSAFLSAFFTLVGTHGLHVFIGSIWMFVMLAHIALRGLEPATITKLACLTLFWHFLDVIWVCIFTFVYLAGSLASI